MLSEVRCGPACVEGRGGVGQVQCGCVPQCFEEQEMNWLLDKK